MLTKNKFFKVLCGVFFVLVLGVCVACDGFASETYANITATDAVYSMGTQIVTIEKSNYGTDMPEVRFKESISAADIVVGNALEGKTVKNVVYVHAACIRIEFEGNTREEGGADKTGTITVKHSGLLSEGDSFCVVSVLKPQLKVSALTVEKIKSGGETRYNIMTSYFLPVGTFTDVATAENIKLADESLGTLVVKLVEDELTLSVSQCSVSAPEAIISAAATSFNKEVVVKLGLYDGAEF